MITSQASAELFGALAAAKDEIQPVEKGKENPFFGSKYMDLDGIKEVVDPVLAKHDLVITQWPDETGNGEPGLTTHVFHKGSGQFAYATSALSLSKKDPQAQGSAITYLKRYAYVAILGIKGVDPDDDGNVATQPDKAVTPKGDKAEGGKASRSATGQKGELERAATEKGWTKAKLTKWYHTEFGKDYKSDGDEQNLAAALVKIVTAPE